jgi:hypothetical protein
VTAVPPEPLAARLNRFGCRLRLRLMRFMHLFPFRSPASRLAAGPSVRHRVIVCV